MRVPVQFEKIFGLFHQDFDLLYPSLEKGVETIVDWLRLKGNLAAKAYIDDLIYGDYSDDQLKGLWNHSTAEIRFKNGDQVRNVLKLLRSKMD